MPTYSKETLSGSTGGRQIKIVQTATPGTTIHTTGTSATIADEVWLYVINNDASTSRTLTIEWGGTTDVDDTIKLTVPPQTGLMVVVPGLILRGDGSAGRTIRAYASAANVLCISGFVNRITP